MCQTVAGLTFRSCWADIQKLGWKETLFILHAVAVTLRICSCLLPGIVRCLLRPKFAVVFLGIG